MKGYTHNEVCRQIELDFLRQAEEIVALLPEMEPIPEGDVLRCHEVARVVAHFTGLKVQDGKYGRIVPNSWLLLPPIEENWPTTRILDPYCIGRLPIVQLVDCDLKLPARTDYAPDAFREDIRRDVVQKLIELVEAARAEEKALTTAPTAEPDEPVDSITAQIRYLALRTLGRQAVERLKFDPEHEPDEETGLPGCWEVGGYLIERHRNALLHYPWVYVLYAIHMDYGSRHEPPSGDVAECGRGTLVEVFTLIHRQHLENAMQALHEGWHYHAEQALLAADPPHARD